MLNTRHVAPVILTMVGFAVIGCSARGTANASTKVIGSNSSLALMSTTTIAAAVSSSAVTPGVSTTGDGSGAAGGGSSTTGAPRSTTVPKGATTTIAAGHRIEDLNNAVDAGNICKVNETLAVLDIDTASTSAFLDEMKSIRSALVESSSFAPPTLKKSWDALAAGVSRVIDQLAKPGATLKSAVERWKDPDFLEAQQNTDQWMAANCG